MQEAIKNKAYESYICVKAKKNQVQVYKSHNTHIPERNPAAHTDTC